MSARLRIQSLWGAACHRVGTPLSRIRPRVSLAAGSILVLLTLFLPVGYEACGPARTGYELARGQGLWPSFLGFTSDAAGRDFYIACLLLAALTVLFVLLSLLRPDLARSASLTAGLFRLAGTVSLFMIFDLFFLLVTLVEGWARAPAYVLAGLACLGPFFFWPRRVFAVWLTLLSGWVALFFIIAELGGATDSPAKWMLILLEIGLTAMPLGVWYRYGFSRSMEGRERWHQMRPGLIAFYTPAVVGALWLLAIAVQERVWGVVPCFFAIHLIAIGYVKLAGEAGATAKAGSP